MGSSKEPYRHDNKTMNKPTLFAVSSPIVDMTPEQSIAYMARVSSPNNQDSHETSLRLLTFLVKQGHWSPFDMVDMTVEIHTSRAIMQQILRHWSFRFQEFSQRYAARPTDEDWSHVEARERHEKGNRQGSGEVCAETSELMQGVCKQLEEGYHHALNKGIAPESARMVMPLAIPTRAYMKGSVRSWMTYFWQRLDSHAQKEHRELAEQIFEIFRGEFPVIADLVLKYKPQIVEQ